jgi:3-hydroxyacyl-CoA dehydrogenase
VIVARDAPGFWVNGILAPVFSEAGWLLAEGALMETSYGINPSTRSVATVW